MKRIGNSSSPFSILFLNGFQATVILTITSAKDESVSKNRFS